jgi:hypothetical protein
LDAYEQIGEQLPLLQEYEALFHHNPHMLQALELMYIDILNFHQDALRFFSGKRKRPRLCVGYALMSIAVWKKFIRSIWKDFGTKFNGILKSLGRHKELVESRANIEQYRAYREDVVEMQSKLDELVATEHSKKRKAVKEWLAVGSQPQQDHESYREIRKEFPSTGNWILKHEIVKDWIQADHPSSPLLWLTGIPGAGE